MLNDLFYLDVVSYENYLHEIVTSDGGYIIYLLKIYHKHDKIFYIHHHCHSELFL